MKANKSLWLVAATIVLLGSVTHATPCTIDVAIPWPDPSSEDADDDCNGDAGCLAGQAEANCIALNAVSDTPRDCSSFSSSSSNVKRQTGVFDCAANELCLVYSDTAVTTLLCLDAMTGDYRDETGGRGNAISRVYTVVDGAIQTFTGTATPTLKGGITAVQTTTITLTAPGGKVTELITSVIFAGSGSGASPAAPGTSGLSVLSVGSGDSEAQATGSSSDAAVGAQSSTTAASVRSSSPVASSGAQSSGVAEQTAGAIVHRLANGALGLAVGVPFFMAVL